MNVKARIFGLTDFFSLETLFKTLFAPWKNDVQAALNISLGDQAKLWEQNFASRIFGFLLRSIVVTISLLIIGLFCALAGLYLLIWLLAPVLIIMLPILALILI